MTAAADERPLLEVVDLRVEFSTAAGTFTAVDGVSLRVAPGRTVALVGESGCGKSATSLSILRLISPPGRIAGGRILFRDANDTPPVDLLALPEPRLRAVRGSRIAMVFQEPMTALNPVYTVGWQIEEAMELHGVARGGAKRRQAQELLRRVGIADPARRMADYPHQMSGGMRQRVMLAMALACRPALLIADEPTTALDATVQQQILDLLRACRADFHLSMLLVTHDLGVVAAMADDVYVMYAGRIVEQGPVDALLSAPAHPYTRALLSCVPRLQDARGRLEVIPGTVPDPSRRPAGCAFHPRCALTREAARTGRRATLHPAGELDGSVLRRCVETYAGEESGAPHLMEIRPRHFVACWESAPTLP
ncbi:MAG: ABC transporter ATP-binding protein [Planctomycetes bacterium]|nr:ABC transporter ATP-binding protein [Planctomycetota bacterium]